MQLANFKILCRAEGVATIGPDGRLQLLAAPAAASIPQQNMGLGIDFNGQGINDPEDGQDTGALALNQSSPLRFSPGNQNLFLVQQFNQGWDDLPPQGPPPYQITPAPVTLQQS